MILYVIAGILFGLLSGLLPGLHSNTVISVLSSLGIDESALALIIISLFPAHIVTSFIPSIFFGIPESGTVVAVLPGQRMVLDGRGIQALKTILFSCIIAALVSVALFQVALDVFPLVYGSVKGYMAYILLGISIILILRSRNPILSLPFFILSGILGYFSLNSGMRDPFLPLFSGMFAIAAMAAYQRSEIPEQKDLPVGDGFLKYSLAGVALGFIADLIPGVGSPSQVAAFLSIFMPLNTLGYLAAISSISISEAVFSLATSASIAKSRMGATASLSGYMDIGDNLGMLLSLFLIGMAVTVLLIYISRKKIAKLALLDFSKMNLVLGAYLVSVTFAIDGIAGIAVLLAGTGLGYLTIKAGAERINLMGAIILPTLLLLFRIFI